MKYDISIAKMYGKRPHLEIKVFDENDNVIEDCAEWYYEIDRAIEKAKDLKEKYPASVVFFADVKIGKRRAIAI